MKMFSFVSAFKTYSVMKFNVFDAVEDLCSESGYKVWSPLVARTKPEQAALGESQLDFNERPESEHFAVSALFGEIL